MSGRTRGSKSLVVFNGASSLITQIIRITVLVWVNQYLIRRISPDEYALFPLVSSLLVFAECIKNIFTGGLGRYIVEADARGDDREVGRVVSSMFPFLVGVALLLASIGGLVIWRIDSLLELKSAQVGDARLMLGLLVLMLVMDFVIGPFTAGLYVRQRFVVQNMVDLGQEALRLIILLALLFGVSTRVLWLVAASTAAGLVRMCVLWGMTRRILPSVRLHRHLFSLETARKLMGFGAWTSVQGIVNLMSSTVPFLLLNRFGSAVDLACLHLGRLPEVQLRNLISVGLAPMVPALTSLYAREGSGALERLYFRGNRYILWMALAIIAPSVVFAGPIIDAYAGDKYKDAAVVMAVFLGRFPLIFCNAMFYHVAHASARIGAYYITEVVIQIGTLAALYVAIVNQGMGAIGAAVAISVAGTGLQILLTWPLGLRLVNRGWMEFMSKTLVPGLLPFAVAAGFCLGFRSLFELDSWLMIGAGFLCSTLIYAQVIWMFGLDSEDRMQLDRVLLRVRSLIGKARSQDVFRDDKV